MSLRDLAAREAMATRPAPSPGEHEIERRRIVRWLLARADEAPPATAKTLVRLVRRIEQLEHWSEANDKP